MLTYEPMMGDNIDNTVSEAVALSVRNNQQVSFTFNGLAIVVDPKDSTSDVLNQWQEKSDKRRKEYLESDEYKKYKKEQDERNKKDQEKIDVLLNKLHPDMTQDAIVSWCGYFADINDNIYVKYSKQSIAGTLKASGYKSGDCVGANMECKDSFAKWLVGQSISMLESGMPIHPQLSRFAKEYNEKFE